MNSISTKNIEELTFLIFCKSFYFVSGEKTNSESEYWKLIIDAEINVRKFLISKNISVIKQEEFSFASIADGLLLGTKVRTVQAHYGIFISGQPFEDLSIKELERKYQKALQISERIVIMGCHNKESPLLERKPNSMRSDGTSGALRTAKPA